MRESGRSLTIGGGEILDVDPITPASRAQPSKSVEHVIAERKVLDVKFLEKLTGVIRAPNVGCWAVEPNYLQLTRERLKQSVDKAGKKGVNLAELSEFEKCVVETVDGITVEAGYALPVDAVSILQKHPFLEQVSSAPFTPPEPCGVHRSELNRLVQQGLLKESQNIFFAASAVDKATQIIAQLFHAHTERDHAEPVKLTVAQVRDALQTSRKYTLAMLKILDDTGVTRRRGEHRIAGPRLPQAEL